MDKIQIKASVRDEKKNMTKLRNDGFIPAVLYGNKVQTTSLTLNAREFDKVFKKAGESTIVDLLTEDGKTHPVLIQDVQIHYLTSNPIHVDFYEVSMTEKLKAMVVLEYVGEAPVIRTTGAILVKILNEVEVECLAADLPHNIEVNLETLKTLQDAIHVKDLKVSAKVKILTEGNELVTKVQPPRDVEADLSTPVIEDVSKVEGAAEIKPDAAAGAKPEKAEKKEDKK
jgi:large subunit ribosomal protein L25